MKKLFYAREGNPPSHAAGGCYERSASDLIRKKSLFRSIISLAIVVITLVGSLAFPPQSINLVAADSALRQVTVYDNGKYHQVLVGVTSVAGVMHEMGIALCDAARTNYAKELPVQDGMIITIERKLHFNVQVDNATIRTKAVWPNTSLEYVLIQLQNEENLPLIYRGNHTRQIVNGEKLNLKSRQTRIETEIVMLPYETHENHTSYVWRGDTHVRQAGSPGEHEITTEIIYIGGVEQNRMVIGESVLVEPTDAIIDVGTAQLGALADVTAPDFHYVRQVRMEATAYTAGFSCTGKRPCHPWYRITASGRRVEHGIVAVDRNVIPLGTRLYVEGYGFAIAADVGGAIRGYKIDLFMESLQDARRFGRRHLYVWILD